VRREAAAGAILAEMRLRRPDLLVIASRCHHGLSRWRYGSVADEVLRHSEVPMLLIPPQCRAGCWEQPAQRVVLTLDGSALSEAAIAPAVLLSQALPAELRLLRVVTPPDPILIAEAVRVVNLDSDMLEAEARDYLEHVASQLRPVVSTVIPEVVTGMPATVINTYASLQGCSVIAMATHGRGGISRLFLGSVTTEALYHASVPFLLVHPDTTHSRRASLAAALPEPASQPPTPPAALPDR
jgi:nucleotide-binding universal stress UspA family protein